MEKEYESIQRDYLRISAEARNKLTALSVVVIGAIYFFSNAQNQKILKWSLLCFFLTILGEIISSFLKSQHYSLWFENKIQNIDYTQSPYGRAAEVFFWIPFLVFFIGAALFFIGMFSSDTVRQDVTSVPKYSAKEFTHHDQFHERNRSYCKYQKHHRHHD